MESRHSERLADARYWVSGDGDYLDTIYTAVERERWDGNTNDCSAPHPSYDQYTALHRYGRWDYYHHYYDH
jgi:hypothetical protein